MRITVVSGPPSLSSVAVDGSLELGGRAQVLHVALVGVDVLGVSGEIVKKEESEF